MSRPGATTAPAGLVLAAALAWWLSVDRMRGMNAGPSAELGGLGWFTATWLLMMNRGQPRVTQAAFVAHVSNLG